MNIYPQNLVSSEWLAENLDDPRLVLLDASVKGAGAPCIPGARRFDFEQQICDQQSPLPNTMPDAEYFQQQVRQLGVSFDSVIVVYDKQGLFSAARAWWMFKAMGHDQVAILDGGLPAWLSAGHPTDNSLTPASETGDFIAEPRDGYFVDADVVLNAIGLPDHSILDARSAERFYGKSPEPREGMRAGHIPSSRNLPYASIAPNGILLTLEELETHFGPHIPTPQQQLICTCGSGVTACILALGATLCGHDNISVYDGSWSEWGANSELPIS